MSSGACSLGVASISPQGVSAKSFPSAGILVTHLCFEYAYQEGRPLPALEVEF